MSKLAYKVAKIDCFILTFIGNKYNVHIPKCEIDVIVKILQRCTFV